MRPVEPSWTDIAQTAILGAQLLVLVVAAIVAWHQVREARRLREEQSRPFVVIDFEVEGVLFFLTIANLGTALARDVRVEIDPPLTSAIDNPLSDLKILREGTSTLAPGKVIRTLFDSGIDRKQGDYPDSYRVVARYADQERRRAFEETMDLDLGVYWNLTTVERKDVHDIHTRLTELRDLLRKWTSANGALRQVSFDEDRAETQRRRALLAEQRKKQIGTNAEEPPPETPRLE